MEPSKSAPPLYLSNFRHNDVNEVWWQNSGVPHHLFLNATAEYQTREDASNQHLLASFGMTGFSKLVLLTVRRHDITLL